MKKLIQFCALGLSLTATAAEEYKVTRENWGNVEVVWVEDNRYPVYSVAVYFADGAAREDLKNSAGVLDFTFELMKHGTSKYKQSEIADQLDFYGINPAAQIFHEYSLFSYSGMSKDIVPATQLICHLFKEANFPETEVNTAKKRALSALSNITASPGEYANRIFRGLTFTGTPFSSPVDGSQSSLEKMTSQKLKDALEYVNQKVAKKIYLVGPKEIKDIKSIVSNDCGWNMNADYSRVAELKNKKFTPQYKGGKKIYFSELSGNQSQIRLGQYLPVDAFGDHMDLATFSSGLLGGSFTALLMQEVRVNKGLTYSIYSQAAPQALYGRSLIYTSTKNESVVDTVKAIASTLKMVKDSEITPDKIARARNFFKGKHMFQFESPDSFMANVVLYEHIGKKISDIYAFPKSIDTFTDNDVLRKIDSLYPFDSSLIFIMGDKSVYDQLVKANIYPVEKIDPKNFL